MTDQDYKKWMTIALALAQQGAEQGEVPVGALLVRAGEVIGQGWNRPVGSHDPSAHAEIIALRDAAQRQQNYRLSGSTLFVTIEPCTMCFGAIMHARVERLVYGASEPRAGVCESRLQLPQEDFYNHRLEVVRGVLAEEAGQLLKTFFAERRRGK